MSELTLLHDFKLCYHILCVFNQFICLISHENKRQKMFICLGCCSWAVAKIWLRLGHCHADNSKLITLCLTVMSYHQKKFGNRWCTEVTTLWTYSPLSGISTAVPLQKQAFSQVKKRSSVLKISKLSSYALMVWVIVLLLLKAGKSGKRKTTWSPCFSFHIS